MKPLFAGAPPRILGIPVMYDPELTQVACAPYPWPFKAILVGDAWMQLPERQRAAILFHEARHCLAWHWEKRLLLLPCMIFAPEWVRRKLRAQELECDQFAAKMGYRDAFVDYLAAHPAPPHEFGFYPSTYARLAALL